MLYKGNGSNSDLKIQMSLISMTGQVCGRIVTGRVKRISKPLGGEARGGLGRGERAAISFSHLDK